MRLLVGIDGSETGIKALRYALRVAGATDGAVTVAYSVDPEAYSTGGGVPVSADDTDRRLVLEPEADAERRGTEALDEAVDFARKHGAEVTTELLYGDPVTELADYASDNAFDGIVVGHRGLSKRTERVVGSVAKGLVSGATVPVTVVR
jgi:nucleotide-binding universal stress UspA family protein